MRHTGGRCAAARAGVVWPQECRLRKPFCGILIPPSPTNTTSTARLPGHSLTMFGRTSEPSTVLSHPPHPFYPLEVELVGYLANDKNTVQLLGIFAAGCVLICSATWTGMNRYAPTLGVKDRLATLWFVLSMRSHLPGCWIRNANSAQPARYISSSKATSPSTTPAWHRPTTYSANSGKSTPCRTRDT